MWVGNLAVLLLLTLRKSTDSLGPSVSSSEKGGKWRCQRSPRPLPSVGRELDPWKCLQIYCLFSADVKVI